MQTFVNIWIFDKRWQPFAALAEFMRVRAWSDKKMSLVITTKNERWTMKRTTKAEWHDDAVNEIGARRLIHIAAIINYG